MDTGSFVNSVTLGIIEGLTEFLPVSSTGHMLLTDHFFGIENQNAVFEIVIQLGAILAVVVLYFQRLLRAVLDLPTRREARQFAISVLAAFVPSVILGGLLHDFIKRVLFASPSLIAWMLITGGVVILLVERMPKKETHKDAEQLPLRTSLGIGLCQCVAMIPGVSRSGATIVGALLLGVERKAAAEFSFFLSIPTMVAAATYDLYKNIHTLNANDLSEIGVGFVVAFLSALVVVRGFIGFVGRFGLVPFAWYRIIAGAAVLVALALSA